MCHVEERTGGVALHSHVSRLCEPRQWAEGAGSCDLGFVLFVSSQVRYAADSVALHLDVRGEHLSDKRREATESHDKHLVVR
jgi:hypothetical protein